MSEIGEDEQEEPESENDINYNFDENQPESSDSSDSEENIVSKTILEKRKAKEAEAELQPPKKRQKVADNEAKGIVQDSKIPNQLNLQKQTDEMANILGKKEKMKKEVDVDFEYVVPSEPYFHIVRTLLNQFLDGED